MTFQQLEYIVAVEKSRHFVNAATACGVTQSTLSSTISKLEQEIDVVIFDRSKHPIEPTPMGERIIRQAEVILHNSAQLRSLIQDERENTQGELPVGMIPTVAATIFPLFSRIIAESAPHLQVHVKSEESGKLIDALLKSELDMILLDSSELRESSLMSIDLWTERFMVYASANHPLYNLENIRPEEMRDGTIWTLRSFHDQYPQLADVTHQSTWRHTYLDSGCLNTLVAAVDANGGYTLLPETFAVCLTPDQRKGLHSINSGKYFRTIALAMRPDYLREGMLNIMTDAIRRIIPHNLLASRIVKYDRVKL